MAPCYAGCRMRERASRYPARMCAGLSSTGDWLHGRVGGDGLTGCGWLVEGDGGGD